MNKTIIINISGIIFHIEEDAYEMLKNYMNDVKRHFSSSEDSFEIITDIENRVAEMFSETLKKENRQVLLPTDITTVINKMGKVTDFEDTGSTISESAELYNKFETKKRLYRDPDNKIIGGVCSGVASYFDIDPIWIRLVLAALFFIFGTGFLLYILLWIIVPKAKTRTEKMQMKGQKMDLSGITQSVKEELGDLRRNFNSAGKEIVPASAKVKNFIQELVELVLRLLGGIVRVIAVVASGLFLIIGFVMIIAVFIVFMAALNIIPSDYENIFPLQLNNSSLQEFATVSTAIAIIIPFIAICFLSVKVLFKNAYINRKLALYLFLFWIVSLGCVIYSAAKITKDFREVGKLEKTEMLKPNKSNVYYLNLNGMTPFSPEDSTSINFQIFGMKKTTVLRGKNIETDWNQVEISIELSDNDQISLVSTASSHGNTLSDAIREAEKVRYSYVQSDSTITFDPIFVFSEKTLYRNQDMELVLKIPENTRLIINGGLNEYLNNINLWECKHDEERDFREQKTEWIMTKNGLVCKEKMNLELENKGEVMMDSLQENL